MPPKLIIAGNVLLQSGAVIAPPVSAILGQWRTDDRKALVEIARCGDTICGHIARVIDRGPGVPATDIHNPNARLRARPIVGLPILYGFTWRSDKAGGGRAYDPKTGKSYRATLEANPDGSLKVTGCVLFICESKRWVRLR